MSNPYEVSTLLFEKLIFFFKVLYKHIACAFMLSEYNELLLLKLAFMQWLCWVFVYLRSDLTV